MMGGSNSSGTQKEYEENIKKADAEKIISVLKINIEDTPEEIDDYVNTLRLTPEIKSFIITKVLTVKAAEEKRQSMFHELPERDHTEEEEE
jgi:hypothetical protein